MRTLKEFHPITDTILRLCVASWSFKSEPPLAKILAENPRLVVAINHSTPLSWLPASLLLMHKAVEAGFGERTPLGVMDHFFHETPLLKHLAEFVTQTKRPLNFQEIIEQFHSDRYFDLVIYPEGSNCFFGNPREVQAFRSPRFVEIAIRAEVPLLLCVHRGSEKWAMPLKVDSLQENFLKYLPRFLRTRLQTSGIFTLPLLPSQIEHFSMSCCLYKPSLKLAQLSEDPLELRAQISLEAERIRTQMIEMLFALDSRRDTRRDARRDAREHHPQLN